MQFPQRFWKGIESGSVTVATRRWKRPSVRAGGTLQSPAGLLGIDSVDPISIDELGALAVRDGGYANLDELLDQLNRNSEGQLYRIRFHRIGADPRLALRNDDQLSEDDLASIESRLERFDRASKDGPWTHQTMNLIALHPGRRAPDLAAMAGRETAPFKVNVRKLKALGLTESLEVGYRLSPRAVAYLKLLEG